MYHTLVQTCVYVLKEEITKYRNHKMKPVRTKIKVLYGFSLDDVDEGPLY